MTVLNTVNQERSGEENGKKEKGILD